jgi:hypothetical protein
VTASYYDSDQAVITETVVPSLLPNETRAVRVQVRFPEPWPQPVRGDLFVVSGDYVDRSRRNRYEIVPFRAPPEIRTSPGAD